MGVAPVEMQLLITSWHPVARQGLVLSYSRTRQSLHIYFVSGCDNCELRTPCLGQILPEAVVSSWGELCDQQTFLLLPGEQLSPFCLGANPE